MTKDELIATGKPVIDQNDGTNHLAVYLTDALAYGTSERASAELEQSRLVLDLCVELKIPHTHNRAKILDALDAIRVSEREAGIIEAAKATCKRCESDVPEERAHFHRWFHKVGVGFSPAACIAGPIHDLLAKMKEQSNGQ